jgi:hypothetical protein
MATVVEMRGRRAAKQTGWVAKLDQEQVLEVVRCAARLAAGPVGSRQESFRGIVDALVAGIPAGRFEALRDAFVRAAEDGCGVA